MNPLKETKNYTTEIIIKCIELVQHSDREILFASHLGNLVCSYIIKDQQGLQKLGQIQLLGASLLLWDCKNGVLLVEEHEAIVDNKGISKLSLLTEEADGLSVQSTTLLEKLESWILSWCFINENVILCFDTYERKLVDLKIT